MKFTALVFAILVFAISAVNAVKEQAVLEFLETPGVFSPEYKLRLSLLWSDTSYEITLHTEEPHWIASYPTTSRGMVEFDEAPNGPYHAVINDNDINGRSKKFTIDLIRPGGEFHFRGESVTEEWIVDLPGDGYVRPNGNDDFGYSHHRFYRNQHRHSCKDEIA